MRIDPLVDVWPRVIAWTEAEPDRTALELLQRLIRGTPGPVDDEHLRTLQRRVKGWRQTAVRRLIFADGSNLGDPWLPRGRIRRLIC